MSDNNPDNQAFENRLMARIEKLSSDMFAEFGKINTRLSALETRADSIESRLSNIEHEVRLLRISIDSLAADALHIDSIAKDHERRITELESNAS